MHYREDPFRMAYEIRSTGRRGELANGGQALPGLVLSRAGAPPMKMRGGLMSAARPSGCRACQPFRPCMPPVPRRAVTAVTGPSLIGSALPPSPCHPRASEPGSPGQGPPFLPPYSPSVLDGLRPHRARGAPGKCESGRCYTGVIGVSSSNSSRPRRS